MMNRMDKDCASFAGTATVLWVLNGFDPASHKSQFGVPYVMGFFEAIVIHHF
jgi:hypothetical protein